MFCEKNAVRVTASSSGRSMLLLPVKFSHCLRCSDPHSSGPIRTDFHTDYIRRGTRRSAELGVQFLGSSGCRMKDVADLRELGLIQ